MLKKDDGGAGGEAPLLRRDSSGGGGGPVRRLPSSGTVLTTEVPYPQNITLANFGMFLLYPTLVYQTQYPRSARIRKRWLAKRVFELLVSLGLIAFLMDQYVVPTMQNATGDMAKVDAAVTGASLLDPRSLGAAARTVRGHAPPLVERVLELAVPSLYVWLVGFFGLFHTFLNIVAELTRFGDRLFYTDWWNATTVEQYWKKWNLPMHHWLLRHVYFPALRRGARKKQALLLVFFISAVLHEVLASVPCRTFRTWAFWGMMGQVPLVVLTRYLDKLLSRDGHQTQIGNVIFWVSFCFVGQPLCLLLYFYDYSVRNPHHPG